MNLDDLLGKLIPGDEIVITNGQHPVARLLPFAGARAPHPPGEFTGRFKLLPASEQAEFSSKLFSKVLSCSNPFPGSNVDRRSEFKSLSMFPRVLVQPRTMDAEIQCCQATKGFVYVLMNAAMPDLLKIGKTIRSSDDRASELSQSTGVPCGFIVAFEVEVSDCDAAERLIHQELAACRYTENREFFKLPLKDVIPVLLRAREFFPTPIHVPNISALSRACRDNDYSRAQELLSSGFNPNLVEPDGTVPLMWAAISNAVRIGKVLVQKGARIDFSAPDGRTALDMARLRGSKCGDFVKFLEAKMPWDLNWLNNPTSRLILACKRNDMEGVRRNLESGADPNFGFNHGESAMAVAVALRNEEILELLLQSRGDAKFLRATPWSPSFLRRLIHRKLLDPVEASAILQEHGRLMDANEILSGTITQAKVS